MKKRSLAAILLLLLLVAACDRSEQAADPSPSPQLIGVLNPAVTQATIEQTICVRGWTAKIRPPASYTSALKRRQLPAGASPAAFEEDHLMPLALGGAPWDPANLRPVPIARAKADDRWETRLHEMVCNGTLTLAEGQQQISDIKSQGEP